MSMSSIFWYTWHAVCLHWWFVFFNFLSHVNLRVFIKLFIWGIPRLLSPIFYTAVSLLIISPFLFHTKRKTIFEDLLFINVFRIPKRRTSEEERSCREEIKWAKTSRGGTFNNSGFSADSNLISASTVPHHAGAQSRLGGGREATHNQVSRYRFWRCWKAVPFVQLYARNGISWSMLRSSGSQWSS